MFHYNRIDIFADIDFDFVFSLNIFSLDIHRLQDTRERGRSILTPPFHFPAFREHLPINPMITGESSPLKLYNDR